MGCTQLGFHLKPVLRADFQLFTAVPRPKSLDIWLHSSPPPSNLRMKLCTRLPLADAHPQIFLSKSEHLSIFKAPPTDFAAVPAPTSRHLAIQLPTTFESEDTNLHEAPPHRCAFEEFFLSESEHFSIFKAPNSVPSAALCTRFAASLRPTRVSRPQTRWACVLGPQLSMAAPVVTICAHVC